MKTDLASLSGREMLPRDFSHADDNVSKRTLIFVINSIGFGGAERALSNILEAIGSRASQYTVHVVLLDRLPDARALPDYVKIDRLDARGSLVRSIYLLSKYLRQHQPVLVVSLLVRANVSAGLVARWRRLKHIACERMHLSSHLDGRYSGLKRVLVGMAPRLVYRHIPLMLGVSTGVSKDLVARFGVHPDHIRTIHNPYNLDAIRSDGLVPPEIELPEKFIVAVGRLEPSKNFAQLISAFLVSGSRGDLVIMGEGSNRTALEQQIRTAGASGRIHLIGYMRNPFAIISRADYFVSSSLNEGFPNAMVEAMALGKAVVATDCPSGPAEILVGSAEPASPVICEGEFGLLVPVNSIEAMAAAMRHMDDLVIRQKYEKRAAQRAEDFALMRVAEHYWSVFDEISD
jgi:glycosyltransferase involved in cell wall biosynthesis